MLKIKEGIDLKELEKFGFEPEYFESKYFGIEKTLCGYIKKTTDYEFKSPTSGETLHKFDGGIEVHPTTRHIYLITENYVGNDAFFDLDLIYDLIQAGFIEKVTKQG